MHRHACGYGHYWDCDGSAVREDDLQPSVCICLEHGVPLEDGDHSKCSVEVLTCPDHQAEQGRIPEAMAPLRRDEVNDGFVRPELPEGFEEMVQKWLDHAGPRIGFCFLCGNPISAPEELIPGTSTHDCAEGRALVAGIGSESAR